MKQLVRAKFTSFGLKVPKDWKKPQGEGGADHYNDSFEKSELSTAPGAPPLFQPATMNAYHTKTQKQHIKDYGDFMDGIVDAICSAWGKWQSLASMTGVLVNGPTASGGMVVGPPLAPLILAEAPKSKMNHIKWSTAIANAIGTGWASFQSSIKVPGLPWYPAFVMVTLPMAPPTPNVPTPVMTLTSVKVSLSVSALKGSMISNLGDPNAPHHAELFESVADGFDKVLTMWMGTTMVTNVLGTGPVPTFAPPVVPGGPVVGGTGNMPPGGFK
ncbi:MAG: hypothetical protein SFX73_19095 [Kofleriaceae bacterium]|nr:hypothetical protein [Kofleriaceae bacterium]